MIKPYSPKVKKFGAESTKPQSVLVKDFAKNEYLSQILSISSIMIMIRKVLKIKFRGRRRAGPRQLMSGSQSVLAKPETSKLMRSVQIDRHIYKLSARVYRMVIKLKQMKRKC